MNKAGYIYKITSPTGRIYIGQTVNIKNRMGVYSRCVSKSQTALRRSVDKYGWGQHTWQVIEFLTCDAEKLDKLETYWIDFYKSNVKRYPKTNGLNLTDGGKGNRGGFHSDKTKEKIRITSTGRKHSIETKKKISDITKGRIVPPHVIEQLRIRLTGNKYAGSSCYKLILNTVTGVYYDSLREASEVYGINKQTLSRYLLGQRRNITDLIYA